MTGGPGGARAALVYQLVGGQPTINEYELQRNPLGPLQGWGDEVVPALR